ncbi:MAG: cytidylate kinase-like family protein [Desulfobacteraceae bacterium]|nr:MAG: cytidylate kinase-like family protein [Desulfobacteraceae bacterium]
MAIITISRGSFSHGRDVAEMVSEELGYQCVGREMILEASREFNIPDIRLERAIHDAPSILDSFTYGRERYIAYFEAAFLKYLKRDNVVYHGLAGHFFLKGVAHALKVRIIADPEERAGLEAARENISPEAALKMLKKDDQERQKWSKSLYGIDTGDSSLYDLVIHIRKIGKKEAAEIICHTAGLENFQTTYDSQKALENLAMAAEVKAALIDLKPDLRVTAANGNVRIETKNADNPEILAEMEEIARRVPGVENVEIKFIRKVDWTD